MKLRRENVYITNIVKCRPPNNREPNRQETEECRGYLFEQIETIQPKVIVTLGNVPTHFFIPSRSGVTTLRGTFYPFENIQVMPTFHPSYLIRNESNRLLKKMVWEDMKKVMAYLGKT
jgi:DNA polymerase